MLRLEIKELTRFSDILSFIKVPWRIYRGDQNWVAPLIVERKQFFNPRKNPFFEHARVRFFVVYQKNQIVGRIAAIVNYRHNEFHREKCGFFGFFECIQDFTVARLMLDTVRDWLKSQEMTIMRGPANYSTNEEVGFLLEGFGRPPTIMMSYNPPYYNDFMVRYGMTKAHDLYAYLLEKAQSPSARILRISEKIKQREGLTIRSIRMNDFDNEVARLKHIYNQAWEPNWGFIPMTDSEFDYIAKQFKQIVDPELALIAEVHGEPAGFSLALPDINQVLIHLKGRLFPFGLLKLLWLTKISRVIDGMRVITMGVVKKFQKRGIDSVFFTETYQRGLKKGYSWAELSWVLESNVLMNRAAATMGARLYKKYRIYEISL